MDPPSLRRDRPRIGPWSPSARDGIRPRYELGKAAYAEGAGELMSPTPSVSRARLAPVSARRSALGAGQTRVRVDLVVGHGRTGGDVDPERLVEGSTLGKLREVVGRPVRGVGVGHVGE